MEAVRSSEIKTLVVIRFSALGDVALIVPVLLAFSEAYPDIHILVCTRSRFTPLFNSIPNVAVLEADLKGEHKGIFGLSRMYKHISNVRPELILDLHNVLRTKVLRAFNRFEGYPFKVLDKARAEKRRLTRVRKKEWRPLTHTTERYAAVFKAAGFPVKLRKDHVFPARPIRDAGLEGSLKGNVLVGVAPFAAYASKMYDLQLLEQVIAWLDTKVNCKILIFGGGDTEKKRIHPWEERFVNCINLIGRYGFEEELNVIGNLDLMLSMDSGNGHLSAIFGVPTLTLWGVTHPFAGFAPYGQPQENSLLADRSRFPAIPTSIYGNRYPEGYDKAINTIPVSLIKERIKSILNWD